MKRKKTRRRAPVVETARGPTADITNLLLASDNLESERAGLTSDYPAELTRQHLLIAAEAARAANVDTLVTRRNQIADVESKHSARLAAIDLFIKQFEEIAGELIRKFPQEADQTLHTKLTQLEEELARNEPQSETIKRQIARVRRWLGQLPTTSVRTETLKGRRSRAKS